jgi:c-di-GMP-binding flagellar brake protein YcgR
MSAENITFKINEKIEIIDNSITYKANIQDIKRDYVMISMPVSEDKYYIMHKGSTVEFYITGEKEITKFKSEVLGKKVENSISLAILSVPVFVEKIQRREYFRLPVALDAKLSMLTGDRVYSNIKDVPVGFFNRMKACIIVDISGGGLKVAIKEHMSKGHYVIVLMKIPDEIFLLCKIVWVEKDNINRNYRVALRFEGISERDRDKIIKFIFEKMRNQSKILK